MAQQWHKLPKRPVDTNMLTDPSVHPIVLDGRLELQSELEPALEKMKTSEPSKAGSIEFERARGKKENHPNELISLKKGFARYGETQVFSGLDLQINSNQHTLITGPNGSGKSTLLQMITGDNQNCYTNELCLFGKPRGSGESIWEIKKEMGIVSPDLQRNHYIPGSCLQVVLSGFFDSIGIYQKYSSSQQQQASNWLKQIGLGHRLQSSFLTLPYGEQRLCLIARALIKMPRLLILDEPTQGLDQSYRYSLLEALEKIANDNLSTILYASHRSDEFCPFFTQQIDMKHYSRSSQ